MKIQIKVPNTIRQEDIGRIREAEHKGIYTDNELGIAIAIYKFLIVAMTPNNQIMSSYYRRHLEILESFKNARERA